MARKPAKMYRQVKGQAYTRREYTGGVPNNRILGDFMILLASLNWAMTTNNTKRMMEQRNSEQKATTLEIVVWYSLIGTVLLTPLAAWETWQYGIPEPTLTDWYAIF